MSIRQTFVLTLRPLAGPIPVPSRLKRLLKFLLRAYGFKAVTITTGPDNGESEDE